MNRFKLLFNILMVMTIIGLAISYITTLFPTFLPHLTFLEGVGIYCIWTPIHHTLLHMNRDDD